MRLCLGAIAVAVLLLAATPPAAADDASCPAATAMSFTAWNSTLGQTFGSGTREFIFADGDICSDTATKFQQFLTQNPPKGPNTIVVLNSDGGDVGAALTMGRLIRKQKMWTQVGVRFPLLIGANPNIPDNMVPFLQRATAPPFPGYCYSACTLMLLGGVYRFVDYGSNYGVHRFHYVAQVPNPADQAQIDAAQIVQYVGEMGVSPDFVTEMAKSSPDDINDLSVTRMAALNIITPRWQTNWQIAPLSDNSGFFLDGTTFDEWGSHEIAVTCYPKGNRIPTQPTQPANASPLVLLMAFSLDPGARAKAQDLVSHVQNYVLELDDDWETLSDSAMAQKVTIMGSSNRLTAIVNIHQSGIDSLSSVKHIGFAYMFDPNAKLPLRLLQFVSDFDGAKLKAFAATCH